MKIKANFFYKGLYTSKYDYDFLILTRRFCYHWCSADNTYLRRDVKDIHLKDIELHFHKLGTFTVQDENRIQERLCSEKTLESFQEILNDHFPEIVL